MWIHVKKLHRVPYTVLLSHQTGYAGKITFQWWAYVTGATDALCRETLDAVYTKTHSVPTRYILPRTSAVA